jgi:hypothetical protein
MQSVAVRELAAERALAAHRSRAAQRPDSAGVGSDCTHVTCHNIVKYFIYSNLQVAERVGFELCRAL